MAKRAYTGRGESGLKGREQLQKDIQKLSDPAKRERATVKKVAAKQAKIRKKSSSLSKVAARKVVDRFSTTRTRLGKLQRMVADLRTKAKEVEASGTGNVKAAATYRRAAALRKKQIVALRKKLKGK